MTNDAIFGSGRRRDFSARVGAVGVWRPLGRARMCMIGFVSVPLGGVSVVLALSGGWVEASLVALFAMVFVWLLYVRPWCGLDHDRLLVVNMLSTRSVLIGEIRSISPGYGGAELLLSSGKSVTVAALQKSLLAQMFTLETNTDRAVYAIQDVGRQVGHDLEIVGYVGKGQHDSSSG